MWPDRVSNSGPLTYESGALPTVLHRPADKIGTFLSATVSINHDISRLIIEIY